MPLRVPRIKVGELVVDAVGELPVGDIEGRCGEVSHLDVLRVGAGRVIHDLADDHLFGAKRSESEGEIEERKGDGGCLHRIGGIFWGGEEKEEPIALSDSGKILIVREETEEGDKKIAVIVPIDDSPGPLTVRAL
jgi:hypothetical protein